MSFEQTIRDELAATPFSDRERRSILKVVLGEIQRIPPTMRTTDEAGYKIVKDMIKANEGLMSHLGDDSLKCQGLARENLVLRPLLPSFWSEEDVLAFLVKEGLDLKAVKGDGAAMGQAMKALKTANAPVEGETVRRVVQALRQDAVFDSSAVVSELRS